MDGWGDESCYSSSSGEWGIMKPTDGSTILDKTVQIK
jgi:hypothetical protein